MINISKLKRAEDCKGRLKEIVGNEGLMDLAKDGLCPHYILKNPITGDESFWFVPSEINDWFAENYIRYNEGSFTPEINFIDFSPIKPDCDVPIELTRIRDLCELPIGAVNTPPGVYFLCLDGKIQYVGQSTNVANRVTVHAVENKKKFNAVYFIPCPINRLDNLEGALIRRFNPPLNHGAPVGIRGLESEKTMIEMLFIEEKC